MEFLNNFKEYLAKKFYVLYHFWMLPLRYQVTLEGIDEIKKAELSKGKGFLFLSNHPSHLDPSLVGTSLYKAGYKLTIWTMDFVYKNPYTRFVARSPHTTKLIKVPNIHEDRRFKHPKQVRTLIRRTVEGLSEGENILFFPAGYQKFTAREEINGKSAVQRILRQDPNVNIVLVRVTGMWGSRFSKAVSRSERSSAGASGMLKFAWKLLKVIFLNLIFFIPRRKITIELQAAGPDFPRQGTREQINRYIEDYFNKGYGVAGEPLQRVPDYFWKSKYLKHEYNIKYFDFDLSQVPESTKEDVKQIIARVAKIPSSDIDPKMLLDRDLCLDSLEMTDIFVEIEKKYGVPQMVPKNVTTVGHLMAMTAQIPIKSVPIKGEFPEVYHELNLYQKAAQLFGVTVAYLVNILDFHR
jgi:long-chain-fatty-acid--[acyl-carrier-protein] ligase